MERRSDYIFIITVIVIVILLDIGIYIKESEEDRIRELEEKVNTYEQEKYENYCIEDALKQQEGSYEL